MDKLLINKKIKIVTYNCRNVKRSLEDIRGLCRSCDIIALQETWLLPDDVVYLNSIDSEFSCTGTSAVDTEAGMLIGRPHGGVALLWRNSVLSDVVVVPCDNPRVCAIKIRMSDRPLLVFSVYMPTDSVNNLPDFMDCLGTVSAIIDSCNIEATFIIGDFNAHPNELFYNELLGYCHENDLTCVDTEKLGVMSGAFTFLSEAHGSTRWLDHCVVTKSALCSVVNVNIKYDVLCSDHFPLFIECNVESIRPKHKCKKIVNNKIIWGERSADEINCFTKECNKRLRLVDFPLEMAFCADKICTDSKHSRVIDKLYCNIVTALIESAVASREERCARQSSNNVIGWNRHVREAHREARSSFQTWLHNGRPTCGTFYEEMRKSKKFFKSKLRWCQNHKEQIQMDILAEHYSKNNFSSFWKSTNKLKNRPGLPASVNGVSDSKAIAELFKNYFAIKSLITNVPKEVHDIKKHCKDLGERFSAKVIKKTISSMSRGKSPGHDGLSIEHLQHAGAHLPRVLTMLYNLCVGHSYLPAELIRTVVVPIVKNKTGDISDKANYRPISLATVIAKVFDGLLNETLNKHIVLHNSQFGFRRKLSTESAILCVKHAVRYYTDRQTNVYACFLDLSKAFDLVSYDILWKKLRDLKLAPEIIQIFKFWYENQVNSVRYEDTLSDPYKLECGVRQGGLSSPILFNLYINALIVELNGHHVGCHVDGICMNNISYADDMVLLSASVGGLRELIDVCETYALSHGLKYNATKSKFMVFVSKTKCVYDVPTVRLDGVPLARVHSFKYLGHILTDNMRDDMDIERERRALSVRANMLVRRFARCSMQVKLTLFRAYCTSFYTCSLWINYTQRAYNALRVQYNNAFRMLLQLPRFCSASGMFAIANVDCFHTTMRKRATSIVCRLRGINSSILNTIIDSMNGTFMRSWMTLHAPVSQIWAIS